MNKHIRSKEIYGDKRYGYLFILPVLLGFLIFTLVPMLYTFIMSFTDWSILKHGFAFLGLKNYNDLILKDDRFWKVLLNTLYFSAGLVPLNLMVSLFMALLLKNKLAGMGLFRTIMFTPVVTTLVVWSIVWKFIFGTDAGLINQALRLFGIIGPSWLYDYNLAMPIVIVVSVLKNFGLNMTIFLSALISIPEMYYEAAVMDGASKRKQFFNITIPMLTPTIFMVIMITIIASLKVFSQIYVMTSGGPGDSTKVIVYYIFEKAFKTYQMGYASAIAIILFVIILAITIFQWNMKKRWVFYED
jgi:multiple sugar transport system permease protein